MYYPLYVSNKWVEPLDSYLSDATLTDPAWFKYDDIIKAWRDADSIDGKPYGIPYDGEVTRAGLSQGPVRRKGPEAGRHLRAARRQRQGADRRQCAHLRPRVARLRRRGPEHVHLSVAVARLRRQLDDRQGHRRQFARGGERAHLVRRHARPVRTAGGAQLELARHRRRVLARHGRDLYRRALFGRGHQQSGEIEGRRQDRLRALAQGTERQARHVDLELGLSRSMRRCRDKAKKATWLFITWAASAETQARTSWKFAGAGQALGHQPHLARGGRPSSRPP